MLATSRKSIGNVENIKPFFLLSVVVSQHRIFEYPNLESNLFPIIKFLIEWQQFKVEIPDSWAGTLNSVLANTGEAILKCESWIVFKLKT